MKSGKASESPDVRGDMEQVTLCLLLSALAVNNGPLYRPVIAMGLAYLCFLLVISPFQMIPKASAEGLSGVPKHKKAPMCLTEKTHVR